MRTGGRAWRRLRFLGFPVAVVLALLAASLSPVATNLSPVAANASTPFDLRQCWETREANSRDPKALKLLFIGNSKLFVNNLPAMFAYLAQQKGGRPLKLYAVMGDAYTLGDHWKKGLARRAIAREGPWDYVILQERTGRPEGEPQEYDAALRSYSTEIARAGARMVLFETYTDRAGGHAAVHQAMTSFSKRYRAYMLPVGSAWYQVQRQHPEIELYAVDGHHPSAKGTYLMSCVCYRFFFGKRATELPRVFYSLGKDESTRSIFSSEAEAGILQECADRSSARR